MVSAFTDDLLSASFIIMNLNDYQEQVSQELTTNILPFYAQYLLDEEQGGFYGLISNDLIVDPQAPKGLVQHSRLLWSYAHAARMLKQVSYLALAKRAYDYLLEHFVDGQHGGLYWFVDAAGRPLSTEKITYGHAFAIYGFSEYYLATGDEGSLETAVSLYQLLETKTGDFEFGGYFDAFLADWTRADELNVDEVDAPVAKTMNTHLHILEAYTNLLRAWDNKQLRHRLRALINMMLNHIVDQSRGQMMLHFSSDWQSLTPHISYGHDIEASWLLVEAAEVLGDEGLLAEVKRIAIHMAQAAFEQGVAPDGSMLCEDHDTDRHWWPQAEAMVGFLNAYQLTKQEHFLNASIGSWQFIQENIIDHQYGEWIWGLSDGGAPINREKAGPWKTPYHNGRSCLEIMTRIKQLESIKV